MEEKPIKEQIIDDAVKDFILIYTSETGNEVELYTGNENKQINKLIDLSINKVAGKIEKLKLDDEFHEWYKDILGSDDILNQIIDKIMEGVEK
jgi:hypothetical protein